MELTAIQTPEKNHDSIEPQVDFLGHNTMGLPLAPSFYVISAAFLMLEGLLS
jgi:hypothetical protein